MGTTKEVSVRGKPIRDEGIASGAITPGHLVETTSTARTWKVHATAGGSAIRAFAGINDKKGGDLTDAYATGDEVFVDIFPTGSIVHCILAENQSIAIADKVESAGDGTLQEVATNASFGLFSPHAIIGEALEAVTTATGETARCLVMIW